MVRYTSVIFSMELLSGFGRSIKRKDIIQIDTKVGYPMSDKHVHDENCNHDHDHEHDHEHDEFVLSLTDEEGNDVEMVLVETFDVGEKLYALLLERGNPEADGYIMRLEEEEDGMVLENIEDEAEWKAVEQAYAELVAESEE